MTTEEACCVPSQDLGIAGKLAKHPRPELARFLHEFASKQRIHWYLKHFFACCRSSQGFAEACGFQASKLQFFTPFLPAENQFMADTVLNTENRTEDTTTGVFPALLLLVFSNAFGG